AIDPQRVGIMGWSHGGLITLMNLFAHPKDYQVGYAGVPVCDLVARMGYKGQGYRDLFSAPYHIGKTAEDDVNEYRRRSPAWNAGSDLRSSDADTAQRVEQPAGESGGDRGVGLGLKDGGVEAVLRAGQDAALALVVQRLRQVRGAVGEVGHLGRRRVRRAQRS